MKRSNIEMLKTVAKALGDVGDRIVFVGGATVHLYATSSSAPEPRPTMDVDCIVATASRTEYHALETEIRKRGFRNDQSEGAPLCRWIYDDIKFDLMPTDSEILGFANEWYDDGIRHTIELALDDGQRIRILDTPYFFATKLAALKNRGMSDLRTSTDLEDMVFVLNNRSEVYDEIRAADDKVRNYLSRSFLELLSMDSINEAIAAVLDYGEPLGTQRRIRGTMERIVSI